MLAARVFFFAAVFSARTSAADHERRLDFLGIWDLQVRAKKFVEEWSPSYVCAPPATFLWRFFHNRRVGKSTRPAFKVATIAMQGETPSCLDDESRSPMLRKEVCEYAKLVQAERRRWQDNHLLAPGALRDFQKLSDEAFLSMKGKY